MPTPQRILQVYNQYRRYGGEDTVVDLEAELLRKHGHEVECLTVSTKELEQASLCRLIAAGLGSVWSLRGYFAMKGALSRFSPDLVHVHNTFPLLSPSIYWAADKAGIPLVQTLHNFRLTCANSMLLRSDKPCQACVGRFPWPALRYRCFGQSFWQTAAVVATNVSHRWLGTYQTKVQAYIALTQFSKEIMARSGLPQEGIFVKPNFTADARKPAAQRLPQAVFVGAISRRKGVHLLLQAWTMTARPGNRLLLIGDGPDRADLQRRYAADSSIVWRGFQARDKVMADLAASRWLVLPSLCYEGLPMVLLEAFSLGTPVIVPDHGAFPSLVSHLEEGLLFSSGDASSLAARLGEALSSTDSVWARWSANAHRKYLSEYTERRNYERLISIYRHTVESFQASPKGQSRARCSRAISPIG